MFDIGRQAGEAQVAKGQGQEEASVGTLWGFGVIVGIGTDFAYSYTRRFVNVTLTNGKRKVRTKWRWNEGNAGLIRLADEPQPWVINNSTKSFPIIHLSSWLIFSVHRLCSKANTGVSSSDNDNGGDASGVIGAGSIFRVCNVVRANGSNKTRFHVRGTSSACSGFARRMGISKLVSLGLRRSQPFM